MSHCEAHAEHSDMPSCHTGKKKKKVDYLLWISLAVVLTAYGLHYFGFSGFEQINAFNTSIFELLNKMFWGIVLGIIFVGILDFIPKEAVMKVLGKGGTFSGILRATGAGVLLDLCSHGILMVGMKLYERGASLGQVMAFLIASPWNSVSLTLILWALIGFKWMLAFLFLSMAIAVISGLIFEKLVKKGTLPKNPNTVKIKQNTSLVSILKESWSKSTFKPTMVFTLLKNGLVGSKMVLRWIMFGLVLASLVRVLLSPENFETFFGPSIAGLGLTIIVATILEVCSEGSVPLAADLITRAGAPGNAFAFLMTGVATDYTEIASLKSTTKSWKIALFLPLVTLPQVLLIAFLINKFII